jgi:hypothetical protein
MILYNVTINIDATIHQEWLTWMKEIHIPQVMETGCFTENKVCRILAEEEGGMSYSIQYFAPDMATYIKYQTEFAPALQEDHTKKYGAKFGAFRTLLEVIHTA